jgi:CRISPR/Cas system-associated exonuclease Cas4 (RecB family)
MSAPRPKYHQSEIHTFLKCGKQWEFRYLRGIKTPPRAAATVGRVVDKAVTHNLIEKVRTGSDVSKQEVLDVFSTQFDAEAKETEWGEDSPGEQKDVGAKLVAIHHEQVAPSIKPATVQEEFVIETDAGYDLGGTFDLTETDDTLGDTKTSNKAYTQDGVDDSIQATLYDFAYEAIRKRPAKHFRFDVLIKPTVKNPPRVQQLITKPSQTRREDLFDTINQMHKAIQAGVALPAPEGSWWCSKNWCGYWHLCKGRKG